MTHTLHRVGSAESLQDDFVVMLMSSKKINREESGPKFQRFLKMALDHGAVKIGDAGLGNEYHQGGVEKVMENVCERSVVVHAVFTDSETVKTFLKAVKAAEFGLSVIVSGLFDKVKEICREVGIEMHTVDQSLGRWGRTDKLPPQDILEINTMCGHGMVTVNLIQDVINDVKKFACTAEEGAERLFRPCQCGVFNPYRAARLLREMCEKSDGSKN
jgi:hypothetical protein